VTVCNDLTSLTARRSETQTVDDVVETSLKENQQLCTGYSLLASGAGERIVELTLKESVRTLYLLLLAKLNLKVRERLATTTMLARPTLSLLNCTLTCVTPFTLKEEFLSLSATQATN
jgi:hypothetical protein